MFKRHEILFAILASFFISCSDADRNNIDAYTIDSSSSINAVIIGDTTELFWQGSGDVSREYFNKEMQKLSSDSTFLMPQEVLGFVPGKNDDTPSTIKRISFEEAKRLFPNTITSMEIRGQVFKDEYYLVFAPIERYGLIQIITKVTTENITVVYTFQKYESSIEFEQPCMDSEEMFGTGMLYLINFDKDLSKAKFDYTSNYSHSWYCGCEETNESCSFLKAFYLLS